MESHGQYAAVGGLGAGDYRCGWHFVGGTVSTGFRGAWDRPCAGDIAVFCHAHGERTGVEKHDDAPL